MAFTERQENDRIEIIGAYRSIQVRRADIVEKDGVEIARTFHRHVLDPLKLDPDGRVIDTDISGEDPDVQEICKAAWTTNVKNAYRELLTAPPEEGMA